VLFNMTDISTLNLSTEVVSKLKAKKILTLTEKEAEVSNAILKGTNIATDAQITAASYVAPIVNILEKGKKLKSTRKPKLIVVSDKKESCDRLVDEIKSLITKELVVVTTHPNIKIKNTKKKSRKCN